jgi:DNA-directed RNA polymerase specialized sigma24 family protein
LRRLGRCIHPRDSARRRRTPSAPVARAARPRGLQRFQERDQVLPLLLGEADAEALVVEAHHRVEITSLDTQTAENVAEPETLADIGAALDELAELEPELAKVVDLKFFCGFAVAEIAAMQGVSERTVQRQWEKARLLLFRAIRARA